MGVSEIEGSSMFISIFRILDDIVRVRVHSLAPYHVMCELFWAQFVH